MKAWRRTAHLWGGRVRGIKALVTMTADDPKARSDAKAGAREGAFNQTPAGPRFVACGYIAPRRRSEQGVA
jgi:hypothetical protein